MFRLPCSLDPQVAPTAMAQSPQGSRAVYTTHSSVGYLPRDVVSLRIRHGHLIRLNFHQLDCSLVGRSDVRAEIAQLFDFTPLFQYFIILDMHLQHTESLTEIVRRQAISARTSPFISMPPFQTNDFNYFSSIAFFISGGHPNEIDLLRLTLG